VPYYGATGQVGTIDDFLFDEELVLLGEDGAPFLDNTKDKAYMIRGKAWVNNHAHVLRGRPGILNTFLMHQLNVIDYWSYPVFVDGYALGPGRPGSCCRSYSAGLR
jgi:type I restriction enzyme, S subunit